MFLTVGMEIAKRITKVKVPFVTSMNHLLVAICDKAVEEEIYAIRGKLAKIEMEMQATKTQTEVSQ